MNYRFLSSARVRGLGISGALLLGMLPATMAPVTGHAAGETLTARFIAATAETDPIGGEAAGTILCGATDPTVGGGCFDLSRFVGQGMVINASLDTGGSTTLFAGFDVNGDHCVSCVQGDGDVSFESGDNGQIGAIVPSAASLTDLKVFVRALSLHDDEGGGVSTHVAITGTLTVQIVTPTQLQGICNQPGLAQCGGPFVFPTLCFPPFQQQLQQLGICPPLPYPYPGGGGPGGTEAQDNDTFNFSGASSGGGNFQSQQCSGMSTSTVGEPTELVIDVEQMSNCSVHAEPVQCQHDPTNGNATWSGTITLDEGTNSLGQRSDTYKGSFTVTFPPFGGTGTVFGTLTETEPGSPLPENEGPAPLSGTISTPVGADPCGPVPVMGNLSTTA